MFLEHFFFFAGYTVYCTDLLCILLHIFQINVQIAKFSHVPPKLQFQ